MAARLGGNLDKRNIFGQVDCHDHGYARLTGKMVQYGRQSVDVFPPEGEITLVTSDRRWHRTGFIRGIRSIEGGRHGSSIIRGDTGIACDRMLVSVGGNRPVVVLLMASSNGHGGLGGDVLDTWSLRGWRHICCQHTLPLSVLCVVLNELDVQVCYVRGNEIAWP